MLAIFQNGQRIIKQILSWFQSALSGNAANRITDYSQVGICKNLFGEFALTPGSSNLSVTVGAGAAYDKNASRIFISSTDTTPYNASNPSTTTNDGLGNLVLTPQSTGCVNVGPLTPSVTNYLWIQFLGTIDVSVFTLHKVTRGKQFYKQTDGYNIEFTTVNAPPDGSGTWVFLGSVNAPASGLVAPSAIFETGRSYSANLPYRTMAQTAMANKADATVSYTPASLIFVDDHIKSVGTGVPSATNPHGLVAADIGINPTAIVQNHQEYFHTNGIRGNPAASNSSFKTLIFAASPADFLTVYGLNNTGPANGIPGEEAIINGITVSNSDFPAPTNITFVGPATDTTASVFFQIVSVPDGTHLEVSSTSGVNPGDTVTQGAATTTVVSVPDGTHLQVGSSVGFRITDLPGTWYIYVDSSLIIFKTQTNLVATPDATKLLLYSVSYSFSGPPGHGDLSSLTDHRAFGTISQYDVQTSAVGAGLTGGGNSPLAANVDGTTIIVNGSNKLQVPAVGLLQTTTSSTSTTTTTTSSTMQATTLVGTITPSNVAHKVLITVMGSLSVADDATAQAGITIFRGSTNLAGAGNSPFIFANAHTGGVTSNGYPTSLSFLDSPASTSLVTYTVKINNTNAVSTNFPSSGGQNAQIILQEVSV